MFSFCFAAQDMYSFPETVVYGDTTYYLHSTDQAEVGEINTWQGGGVGAAIGAAAQFADLDIVFNVDVSAPKEVYDITRQEAKRLEVISKMNLGEELQVYSAKIESELAKSSPDASKLRAYWEDMAVYMDGLRTDTKYVGGLKVDSKSPEYVKRAATFYMKKIGFLNAAGNPVSITDAWVARNGRNMNKVIKAFSSRGAFQIIASTGGSIYEYAQTKLGKITTKMTDLSTKLTAKGFVVNVGALQGLEVAKEGTIWVKMANKVPGAAVITDLVKPFFLEKIDKILTLGRYVTSLKKYDLLMMSRAGKVQTLLDKVKNAKTPETTAKRFTELEDEVSGANKLFKRFGVGEEAFKLTGTGKSASLQVLRGGQIHSIYSYWRERKSCAWYWNEDTWTVKRICKVWVMV